MRCYNLFFNFKVFCKNVGSILALIFFIIYLVFMIYYCMKKILKVEISKILFNYQKEEKMNDKSEK